MSKLIIKRVSYHDRPDASSLRIRPGGAPPLLSPLPGVPGSLPPDLPPVPAAPGPIGRRRVGHRPEIRGRRGAAPQHGAGGHVSGRLLSGKGTALALPLLQQLPQLVREPGQGLVVPPAGALDALHKHVAHGHQPLVGRAGPHAAGGPGLPLREIPGLNHLVGDQVVHLRVLGRVGGEAQALDGLGEEGRHLPVPMDHEHMLGLGRLDGLDPRQQVVPVRVGGEALEVLDPRVDGDLLAEELHALCALQQGAAQGALPLVAHEHHGALRPPEVRRTCRRRR